MTWNARDAAKQRRRTTGRPRDQAEGEVRPWQRETPPPQSSAVSPAQLPTMESAQWWMRQSEEEEAPDFTMEELRHMNMEGLMSEKQWQQWARLCTRGVVEL